MTQPLTKPPILFWIVSVIALIWNIMGVIQYLDQAYSTESFREQYTAEQLQIIANTPAWVTSVFALAVFTGVFGSIALLLRKKWAYALLLVSLICVVAQMFYSLFIINSVEIFGTSSIVMMAVVLIFAILFLLFSKKAITKHWIA